MFGTEPKYADSVISLFKAHDSLVAQITEIQEFNHGKILQPKLEFFYLNGSIAHRLSTSEVLN